MSVVVAENLSRRFGRRWAYARFNLQLEPGERLLLIGANGSGKTTVLRSLATLLPPSLGSLKIFGMDVQSDVDAIRSRIGFLSHKTGLYEDLSAVENLQIFGRLFEKPLSTKEAEYFVSEVGLEIRPDPIRTYSAGMRKRASVALLRLKNPDLILLDEPFSALDPKGVDEIASLFQQMPATQILVSHQVERASRLCTRALLLENGLTRWQGDASQAWLAWQKSQQEPV